MKNKTISKLDFTAKYVDNSLNDKLSTDATYNTILLHNHLKRYFFSLFSLLLLAFTVINAMSQQVTIEKQVLGSSGMIESVDKSGLIMSGLLTQTAIGELNKELMSAGDNLLNFQGFWVPNETFTSVYERPIKLSDKIKNYPNPLRTSTKISYELSAAGNVSLKIYNSLGSIVRELFIGNQEKGIQEVDWDAKNQSGLQVSSGVYLLELNVNPALIAGGASFKPYKFKTMMVVEK